MKRIISSIVVGLAVGYLWAEDYRYDVAPEDLRHAEDIYPVTTADKTAFTGLTLSEWRVAGGFLKGANVASLEAIACKERDTNGVREVWIQAQDGVSYVKGVKVRLWQDGGDVKVRALGAAYVNSVDNTITRGYCEAVDLDNDFENTQTVSSGPSAANYGISRLTLVRKSAAVTVTTPFAEDDTVTLGDYADVTIKAPQALATALPTFTVPRRTKLTIEDMPEQEVGAVFKGAGEVVFTHPTEDEGTRDVVYDNWYILNWPVVATNFFLRDVVGVTADSMYRDSVVSDDVRAFYFSNDGATAHVQLQAKIGGWLRCICVDLRQGAKGVEACIDNSYGRRMMYPPKQSDDFGYDFDTQPIGGSYGIQEFGKGGGLTNLRLALKNRTIVSLVGDLKGDDAMRMTLTAGSNATVVVAGNNVPPSHAVLAAQDGGTMVMNAPGVDWYGLSDQRVHFDVRCGGQILFARASNLRAYGDQRFRVSGGEACFCVGGTTTPADDAQNYVNELILEDGAVLSGKRPRVGNTTSPTWRVRGTSPSTLKSGFLLAPGTGKTVTLNVKDVTGDATPDLTIQGTIGDYNANECAALAKKGAGTVRVDCSWSQKAAFRLYEGTWRLARNATQSGTVNVSLDGGCLFAESSTANAFAALALTKTSQMSIEDDAEISFASTAGTVWAADAKLQIAADLAKCRIRFGTDGTGLTPAQVEHVRVNGKRVKLDESGYLAPDPRGIVLIVR